MDMDARLHPEWASSMGGCILLMESKPQITYLFPAQILTFFDVPVHAQNHGSGYLVVALPAQIYK